MNCGFSRSTLKGAALPGGARVAWRTGRVKPVGGFDRGRWLVIPSGGWGSGEKSSTAGPPRPQAGRGWLPSVRSDSRQEFAAATGEYPVSVTATSSGGRVVPRVAIQKGFSHG